MNQKLQFNRSSGILSLLLIVVGMMICNTMQSRHIIGGDLTYVCTGIDSASNTATYRFTMNMFRDKYNPNGDASPFDREAVIGLYVERNGFWRFESQFLTPLQGPFSISLDDSDPCIIIPENIDIDRGVYEFQLTLPIINNSYMLAYQRCCRNSTITNIFNPGDSGSAFTVVINPEAQQACNSSPVFNSFPEIIICDGEPEILDFSATDPDGDQLIYEFVAPLSAGGPVLDNSGNCNTATPSPELCLPPFVEVGYILPTYSATQPVPGEPPLTINANTGLISGVPVASGLTGSQYVVGIKVTEINSNGIVMGCIQRDFQLNVAQCDNLVNARIGAEFVVDAGGNRSYQIQSCGLNTIDFLNDSGPENFIETYKWSFDVDGDEFSSEDRDVSISFPGTGNYEGELIINEGLSCADTAFINVSLFGNMEADFATDYDTCVLGDVFFDDFSITDNEQIREWTWDFGDGASSALRSPTHRYTAAGDYNVTLIARDNENCVDSITQLVAYKPIPSDIVIQPSTFLGCEPANVFFNNLTELIDSTYDISWNFGDGGESDEISPTYEYNQPGSYTVSVEIVSEFGCGISEDFTNFISVESAPKADFDFDPRNPNSFQTTVQFVDQSVDAISWIWNFNGEGTAREPNPNYTFRDTGIHFVQLIVSHPSGCTDTLTQELDIIPLADYVMPNAFSPNGDGKNDVFKGIGNLVGVTGFSMTIWDRWGTQVFYTEDPVVGWNGQKDNQGQILPQGVYVYVISYNDPRNRSKQLKGYATLLN